MTTNDKTRQKLMDSMRKTKVPANTDPKSTVAASKASKASSSASDENSQTKNTSNAKKKTVMKDNHQVTVDAYQSKGRIWPD